MMIELKRLIIFFRFHIKNFIPHLFISTGIGLLFFLTYLPQENLNISKSFITSLSYGLFISLFIYLGFLCAEIFYKLKKIKNLNFKLEFLIVELGLFLGILMAQLFRSLIFKDSFSWQEIPIVFLSGTFVGLFILYFYRYKNIAKSNEELTYINQKLKSKKEIQYLTSINSKIGNENKLIKIEDILYFTSKDHYSFAVTSQGEYIINPPLKSLIDQIDPEVFFQANRSLIINLKRIDSLKSEGQLIVKTDFGQEFSVSRAQAKKLKEILIKR